LSGDEITSAVAGGDDVRVIAANLVDAAITCGARDNFSVVVAEVAA
jgi:hypothetical protein